TECSGEDGDEAERDQPDGRQPLRCGVPFARSRAARTAQSRNAGGHFGHGPILTIAAARCIRTVVGLVVGMLVSFLNERCYMSRFDAGSGELTRLGLGGAALAQWQVRAARQPRAVRTTANIRAMPDPIPPAP